MHRGAKIGPRITMLVSQGIVATHKALLDTKHKLAMIIFRAISDEISEEVDITLGPVLRDMKERYDAGGPMASFLDFMATGHGQWKAIVGSGVSASGLLSSISLIMNNELFPLVYDAIGSNPHMLPDQQALATMAAQGIIDMDTAQGAIAQNGYGSDWSLAMIQSEQQFPSGSDAIDMYRRGLIDIDTFHMFLNRNGIPSQVWGAIDGLIRQPLSPADAALGVLRGDITQDYANEIGASWGITADDMQVLQANTGEPLGLMQLLEAFRRGFIDESTLTRGILQSRVRNEWIPTAIALRYTPMSVSDAVNAVVQAQLDPATAASYAQQNGLEPDAFPILVNTAGEPPSRDQMFDLYNRGLATEDQVIQAERESRLKNKYNDLIFNLHTKLLEPRLLSELVQYGSLTTEQAIQAAMEYGYSQENATALINEGTARKLETYKTKVVAAIETLYEDGGIDQQTALTAIMALGFTADEAGFIVEAADMRRTTKQTEQVVSAVRSKYLAYHIDAETAQNLLTTAGVPQAEQQYLLAEWLVEQGANVRLLTEAQIVKAVKDQLIPATPADSEAWLGNQPVATRPDVAPVDGETRLIQLGYVKDDADLLLAGA